MSTQALSYTGGNTNWSILSGEKMDTNKIIYALHSVQAILQLGINSEDIFPTRHKYICRRLFISTPFMFGK